ncbi:MAG: hypothetical protein APF78_09395 [Sphingomonadales bacterium BRH_c3]|nr:MAG: hypothetical protein APF78_09395 [Sphingomonadales bacterium BRH_c3]
MNEHIDLLLEEIKRLERKLETALDQLHEDPAFALSKGSEGIGDGTSARLAELQDDVRGIVLWKAARHDINDIDLRARHLPPEACEGPGWHMLLFLLTSRIEQTSVSVTDTCAMARAPQTTALRHLELLVRLGLCQKVPDHSDARRIWIGISDDGYFRMEHYYRDRMKAHRKPLNFRRKR